MIKATDYKTDNGVIQWRIFTMSSLCIFGPALTVFETLTFQFVTSKIQVKAMAMVIFDGEYRGGENWTYTVRLQMFY